jgi:hypothetical protein
MVTTANTRQATGSPRSTGDEYFLGVDNVVKVRAFVSGEVGAYVRRLGGHSNDDYASFQEWAYYLPAVPRTLDAFAGLVMTPEPLVSDAPPAFDPFLADLTTDGEPFQRVAYTAVEEVSATGRYCLLVDYPDVAGAADLTRLDAERAGLRPFVKGYAWEDILAVRSEVVGGVRRLTHVRLLERIEERGATEWETDIIEHVRVLDLFKGRYRVRVFRETTEKARNTQAGAWEQVGADRFPQMNGAAMTYIPAVVIGPNSLDPSIIAKPPLLELVNVSESHLNDSALRQWALKWCGCPTLVISGLIDSGGDDPTPIRFGSSTAIVLGENGSAQLVTMSGEGVGALKESMEEKRRDMAAIGARILADESGAQIATETARIQRAGEHSVLAGIANSVADGLTQVLRWVAEWAKINAPEIAVTLNTDFLPKGLQPGELAEWSAGLQNGTMPLAVFMEHLKSRGVIDPQMTEADWQAGIDETMIDRPDTGGGETEDEEGLDEAA